MESLQLTTVLALHKLRKHTHTHTHTVHPIPKLHKKEIFLLHRHSPEIRLSKQTSFSVHTASGHTTYDSSEVPVLAGLGNRDTVCVCE